MTRTTDLSLLGCAVFLCDFHREQAWNRWFRTKANGCVSIQKQVKKLLHRIANADSVESCNEAIEKLKGSKEWCDHTQLAEYLTNYYLNIVEVMYTQFHEFTLTLSDSSNNQHFNGF